MRVRLFVVAGVVSLAGCGGSASRTVTVASPAIRPVTRARFIAEADAICRAANAKLKPYNDEFVRIKARATTLAGLRPALGSLRHGYRVAQARNDELARLEPPPADAGIVSDYLDALHRRLAAASDLIDGIDSGDLASIGAAADAGLKAQGTQRGIARGYGFRVCGRS